MIYYTKPENKVIKSSTTDQHLCNITLHFARNGMLGYLMTSEINSIYPLLLSSVFLMFPYKEI